MFRLTIRCWSGLVLASSIGVSTLATTAAEPPVRDALYRPQEAPVQARRLPSRGPAPIEYAIIRKARPQASQGVRWNRGAAPIHVQTATSQREMTAVPHTSMTSPASDPILPLFAE